MADFGWSYPPGVSSIPGDDVPLQCDDCQLWEENNEECPFEGEEENCPTLSMVDNCAECGKKIGKVQGKFAQDCVVNGWVNEFCCSPECARTRQGRVDKDIEEFTQDAKEEFKGGV